MQSDIGSKIESCIFHNKLIVKTRYDMAKLTKLIRVYRKIHANYINIFYQRACDDINIII